MSESPERQADQDPAPIKHSDAEMLSSQKSEPAEGEDAHELEDDPARDPDDPERRD